ncbi:MAG: sulfatase family protein [Akkermansiaceae bacterium]
MLHLLTTTLIILTSYVFAETEKPNIVIILGDDISANNIGCYGSENPNTTPNIDKLANEGVQFTNMFVSEAICAPARAELYTGLTPYKNGVTANHGKTKKGTLSIVQHLEALGYRVGLSGKTHIKPASVYPFQKIAGFPTNCNLSDPKPETWDGVEKFMTSDADQPFCIVLASIHAHSPWDAGDTSPWELQDLKLPPNLADTPETRSYFREYLAEVRLFDDQVGKTRALLKKHQLDENTILIVLDENGAGMPGGKWTTYDWGVRSACIMKFPPSYNANFTAPAIAQYCDILPTLIDAAGGKVPEKMDGKSLLPVISSKTKEHRDTAHFIYNSGSDGNKFSSRAITDGRYKLIWTLTPEQPYAVRTINGFDYGYVDKMQDRHVRKMYQSWLLKAKTTPHTNHLVHRFRHRPQFQLFDLNKDPHEMNNLATNPEYTQKIKQLQAQIQTHMTQQNDSGTLR